MVQKIQAKDTAGGGEEPSKAGVSAPVRQDHGGADWGSVGNPASPKGGITL